MLSAVPAPGPACRRMLGLPRPDRSLILLPGLRPAAPSSRGPVRWPGGGWRGWPAPNGQRRPALLRSQRSFTEVLDAFVDAEGLVDYQHWACSRTPRQLQAYVDQLAALPAASFSPAGAKRSRIAGADQRLQTPPPLCRVIEHEPLQGQLRDHPRGVDTMRRHSVAGPVDDPRSPRARAILPQRTQRTAHHAALVCAAVSLPAPAAASRSGRTARCPSSTT